MGYHLHHTPPTPHTPYPSPHPSPQPQPGLAQGEFTNLPERPLPGWLGARTGWEK